MRCWLVVTLLAGCGAQVDGASSDAVDAPVVPPPSEDADPPPPPPPIDARVCAGGDANATAPDGSCLVFFNQPKTFADATAACTAFGSTLAVLTDAQRDATARGLAGTLNVFIGLTDQAQEGAFVWADGTALAFDNFATGEPNDANGAFPEDCIIIRGSNGGQWDDRPCAPDPNTAVPGVYPFLCMF